MPATPVPAPPPARRAAGRSRAVARSLALAIALAIAPTARAQSTVVIPAGAAAVEANDFNNFPWGRGPTGLLHQCVYAPVNFTSQGVSTPITITRLRWRPDDMRASIASSYALGGTVHLSTSPLAWNAVTTTFANQRGADHTQVFSGPVSWPAFAATPGPCPFHIDIPLTTPFTYDPAAGALTIEVDLPIQAFSGTTPLQLDVMTFGSNASRVWLSSGYVNGGPNATTPFSPQVGHGVVVEVTYALPAAFAASTPFGAGCYDVPRSVYERFGAAPFDLNGSGMSMLFDGLDGYVCLPAATSFVPPTAAATVLPLGDDTEAVVQLASALPHPRGSTTQLVVCSNGFVSAGPGNGTHFEGTVAGFLGLSQPCWVGDWHDYDPTAVGSGPVLFEEVANVSYVTWNGVFGFAGNSPNTFQLQFDRATGNVHVVWPSITEPFDHMVGFQAGGPVLDPGNRDLSASLAATFPCGADQRALRLAASARPVLGTTIQLRTTQCGTGTIGLGVLSLARHDPGIELSALGMPSCFLLVDLDLASVHFPANGAFGAPLALPANPALNGMHVGTQSAILGEPFVNAAGIRSSNALDLRLGTQ